MKKLEKEIIINRVGSKKELLVAVFQEIENLSMNCNPKKRRNDIYHQVKCGLKILGVIK